MQWLQRSKTCPEDRKRITESGLHFDFILHNIIMDQQVLCNGVQRLSATVPPQLGKSSNQSHSFGICLL